MQNNKLKSLISSSSVPFYSFFLLSMVLFGFATGLFRGIQDNYFAEILGIGKVERGFVEFFRELPGLLLIFLLAILYRIAERNIIRMALAISVVGVLGFLLAGSHMIWGVAALTIWSTGEHLIMPVRQSYALHSAPEGKGGSAIGFLRGLENIGKVSGLAIVTLIFLSSPIRQDRDNGGRLGYTIVFIGIIAFLILSFLAVLRISKSSGSLNRPRIYFRKKFSKYYGLEMFYGVRKQIFLTFAPYLLILHYGAKTEYLAGLLGISALINIFFTPLLGKIIDKLGYKVVMICDTLILAVVCVTYGFAHRLFSNDIAIIVVSVCFIIDWMLSNASMASSVYIGDISQSKEEMTATLSTGLSINHLISVFIAMIGGIIWKNIGIEVLFVLAAVMAIANSIFAASIKNNSPSGKEVTEKR